ncbi:glu/Leu/Phe/Val dehydrogenase family [Thraustotheca clavata]|uniref:Glu/Leu/Phe/Val dehydrogenase family n=1 Tax=Thraustotheca clavata TaxID=74557 RepID=A0A1V9ZWE0_9STRA|nr:glu/Leu/Phe/Val dehydrogenase family [Thraustotheca clavata]
MDSQIQLSSNKLEVLKNKVISLLIKKSIFTIETIKSEVEWFFGPLGLHEFYFQSHCAEHIAFHIQSTIIAKIGKTSSKEFYTLQNNVNSAFCVVPSNLNLEERCSTKTIHFAGIERNLDWNYLNSSIEYIAHDVEISNKRQYRMQCYHTNGVLTMNPPTHLFVYSLQLPEFKNPNPSSEDTDIAEIADKSFLKCSSANLLMLYQKLLNKAACQVSPVFHSEIWLDSNNTKIARLTICFKSGSARSYFSSLTQVYRGHGLFASRKYVEYLSNGYVIYAFYLQELELDEENFEERIGACILDASLHYSLTNTSLNDQILTSQEIAYAYAALKFSFHFVQPLPDKYSRIFDYLRGQNSDAFSCLEEMCLAIKRNTFKESQIFNCIFDTPDVIKFLYEEFETLHSPKSSNRICKLEETLGSLRNLVTTDQAWSIFEQFVVFNHHIKKTNFYTTQKSALAFQLDGEFLSSNDYSEKPKTIIFVFGSEFRAFYTSFKNISHSNINIIRSPNMEVYDSNVFSCFNDSYNLALSQRGSNGIIVLNYISQKKADLAFKKFVDALLDLIIPQEDGEQKMMLFLDSNENTMHLMDWVQIYAKSRGYTGSHGIPEDNTLHTFEVLSDTK